MNTDVSTVTTKGQVTIPKAIRDALNIRERDQLLFVVEGDRLIVFPIRSRPLRELYGALPATRPYPGHDRIRKEVGRQIGERLARGED